MELPENENYYNLQFPAISKALESIKLRLKPKDENSSSTLITITEVQSMSSNTIFNNHCESKSENSKSNEFVKLKLKSKHSIFLEKCLTKIDKLDINK